ncbi:MAG: beta-galactosidase trimerization domain-containing protein, partial [Spirochaetales bacterium]|nr:beta-galactosidase trimerization domain-containing protein [Spirochaetales bacterium]
DNSMSDITLPGYFKELAGITIEEFDSLSGAAVDIELPFGKGTASIWADIINSENTEVLARYASEYYSGKPAITVNNFGLGHCYYVGCDLDEVSTVCLLELIATRAGVSPALKQMPAEVEAVRKIADDGSEFLVILNHGNKDVVLDLNDYHDCIAEKDLGQCITLKPYESKILSQSLN